MSNLENHTSMVDDIFGGDSTSLGTTTCWKSNPRPYKIRSESFVEGPIIQSHHPQPTTTPAGSQVVYLDVRLPHGTRSGGLHLSAGGMAAWSYTKVHCF